MSNQKRSCPETGAVSSDDSSKNKRQKRQEFNGDDLVCPIETELPWDPVTAEDGRVYERSAITKHIETRQNNGGQVRSPVTNEPMGRQLFPAIQHRNLIESLIDSGMLSGSLADQWNKKRQQMKEKDELIRKANSGDADAMFALGCRYLHGLKGFDKDSKAAHEWFTKGHYAGDVRCTGGMGRNLLRGDGVSKCPKQGLTYLGIAAGQGSHGAAFFLGNVFANGTDGMPVNLKDAIYWLERSLESPDGRYQPLGANYRVSAEQKLPQLRQQLQQEQEQQER